MMRLAFVCSGNICRSPMGAVIAERALKQRGMSGLVISAGTLNLNGHRASWQARHVADEHDLDLDAHRSQGIQTKMITYADHIFTMAPRHGDEILAVYPDLAPKIVELWTYYPEDAEGGPLDQIFDPVGMDIEAFEFCFMLIETAFECWLTQHLGASA